MIVPIKNTRIHKNTKTMGEGTTISTKNITIQVHITKEKLIMDILTRIMKGVIIMLIDDRFLWFCIIINKIEIITLY